MNPISFVKDRSMDLIGLGRACIDLNANEIHRPMEETRTFTKYVGGSPANITIAAAKLGLRTAFVGRVSDDQHGRFIARYLNEHRVDTSNIIVDDSGSVTGLAFTEIKSPADCSILMYRDNVADLKLEPGDVKEELIADARALLISGTALAKSPSREAVFRALEYALRHRTVVIYDIDYRPYSWNSSAEVSVYCKLVAEKSDIILGGQEEFNRMEGRDPAAEFDEVQTAKAWLSQRAQIVLVKRGGDGSVAYMRDGEPIIGRTYPANVVKTFGAGDSFAGAFIYGLFQGWDVGACQQFGSASASIVVSSHSCSDAMPTVEQIQAVIDGVISS